ncbi:MAG: cupin domain-containing protein [bacterium]|nr:MAG: cupin domain-containing protein [bacterium]
MKKSIINLHDIEGKEVVSGLTGRFVHSDHMTVAYWDFDPDVEVLDHSHEHEQIVNVIEGTLDLTVEGETTRLEKDSVVTIPPNAAHSGRSVTRCRVIDIFYPSREDFK